MATSVSRLSSRLEGERVALHYLGLRDEPWLEVLLALCRNFQGKKLIELRARLKEPLGVTAPRSKLRAAVQVVERFLPEQSRPGITPRELRARVFRAASAAGPQHGREQVLGDVAAELGLESEHVEQELLVDLAGERRVGALPPRLTAPELALLVNQALVYTFLKRARQVRISAWGNAQGLVRHARQQGLICVTSQLGPRASGLGEEALAALKLEISGPLALFHKTEVYGRALSSLLLQAARCRHFELEADCQLGRTDAIATLSVSPLDPIFADREQLPAKRTAGDRINARLLRDLKRLGSPWRARRDPAPIEANGTLIFPDLELSHRDDPERIWLVEVVGFWTAGYLRQKLRELAATPSARLFVCVDDRRHVGEEPLAEHPRVLRYQKGIDAAELLRRLEREA